MNFKKNTLFIFGTAILHAFSLVAQTAGGATTQGGTLMPQLNTDFFVGSVNGFYPTIQDAVTKTCALSSGPAANGARVIIPAGSPLDGTSGYTISTVTGGCVKVAIEDRRAIPAGDYKWVTSAYVLQTSGGGTPPVVAGSNQFANSNATNFKSGGQYNEESFNTANNGVVTAQRLGLTNILVPSTSTTSEDVYRAVTLDGTHLRDERGSVLVDYFKNSQPSSSSPISRTTFCEDNRAPSSPTVENHSLCHFIRVWWGESGMDVTGIPTSFITDMQESYFFGNGIHQAHSTLVTAYTDDDMGADYTYAHVRAAQLAGASEGSVLSSKQGFEDSGVSGTVTTGGAGAMTIQTSLINGGLANSAHIIFPSENIASGYITGFTPGTGQLLESIATTDTHTVSSGYGFLTASCGTNTVANSSVSATCPFTTRSGGFGSFSTGIVAVGDWRNFECVKVTAVRGGNITMNMTRTHASGVPIYQGTGSCGKVMQGRGYSPVWAQADGFTPNYQIAGARTSTSWDVVFDWKNGQNGQNPIQLFGPVASGISRASQSRTTVTLTLTSANGGLFNHYTAPSGTSICVSGNSNAAFNQCGITGIVASDGGLTLTYTVGSSASITGTGGTINVGTVSAPTINGLGNYEIDCGAIVTKVLNVGYSQWKGNGSVNLAANNCTMAPGESFIQPNNPAQAFEGQRIGWSGSTPNNVFGGNTINEWIMGGNAWSGGHYINLASEDGGLNIGIRKFQGYGGNQAPRTFLNSGDEQGIGTYFSLSSPPIGVPSSGSVGGALFNIGDWSVFPGTSTKIGSETQYDLFDLDTDVGQIQQRIDTTANSVTWQAQGPAPTFNFGGPINTTGPVSAWGYNGKSLHTKNLLSDSDPPLTLDEQFQDAACRGIYLTQNAGLGNGTRAHICTFSHFSSGDNYSLVFDVGRNLSRALTLQLDHTNSLHSIFAGDVSTPALEVGSSFTVNTAGVMAASAGSTIGGHGLPVVASVTTTASATDVVTITGMTSSGHCTFGATNSAAGVLVATSTTPVFLSAYGTNTVTINHASTAGATFDLVCTPY